jgi:hypothetical protein
MGVDKIPRQTPLSFSDRPQLDVPNGMDISEFHGSYTIDQHPIETDIPCNGCGWDLDDGLAKSVVTVMVDQPRFIEVCLADRLDGENRPADLGVYRAKIDNIELPIRWSRHETVGTNSAIRVHFSIPKKILLQNTDQLVCLCFTKSMEEADLMALRKLYEIKWR